MLSRQHGAVKADVHSVVSSSRLDSIRSVYGVSVAKNLIKVEVSSGESSGCAFDMEGFVSNSNYVSKKTILVLFINGEDFLSSIEMNIYICNSPLFLYSLLVATDRLVECSALKRAIEIVYAATLPKASKPFVYMSINLPREHVDINIHPTKKEVVAFLHLY